jgi:hypothetical protein
VSLRNFFRNLCCLDVSSLSAPSHGCFSSSAVLPFFKKRVCLAGCCCTGVKNGKKKKKKNLAMDDFVLAKKKNLK